jgi:hypothetical protein
LKNKASIIGILLILIGFCITYFFGYKENIFLGIVSYFAFFFGWIIIVMSLFGKHYSFNKPKFKSNKKLWFFKSLKNVGIIIFAVIGIFTSIAITGNITDKRIQNILYTEPNYETIAEIINLEKRHTRGGWKIWAIFQYKTLENKTYTKGIFNYGNMFRKGDKYYIIYSKKYPEIIEIKDKFE